jgi:X box-binding protein 1
MMSGQVTAPKIIVIPQSLLQAQGKSLLRLSPEGRILPASTATVVTTLTNSNIVSRPNITTFSTKPVVNNTTIMMAKPVATVTGQKRPAPVSSPMLDFDDIKEEMDESGSVRKRANLDHLSPEERLMRRKLKNRVAAQTARDKKRAHMEEMEIVVQELRAERRRILEDNQRLQATNNQLQLDNAEFIKENQELKARLSQQDIKQEDHLPPSPVSLPRSPLPSPQLSSPPLRLPTQGPPESAELTSAPQQQEQGPSVEEREQVDPGLSSSDLTTWSAAPFAVWWIMLVMAAINQTTMEAFLTVWENKKEEKRRMTPPPLLPIKKRGVSHWWGMEQRSWDPTMKESPPE